MKRMLLIWAFAVGLIAAGCSSDPVSSDDGRTTATSSPLFPVVVTHDAGEVEIAAKPARIAALSATHIEMLFAMGAGPQVIAGDLFSNYPPESVTDLVLVDSFNVNVEAVIDLSPDLLVISFDPGGVVEAMAAVGIPTLLLGTAGDLEDVYAQILGLGNAAGHRREAEALADSVRHAINDLVAASDGSATGITFYHESDPFSFYTPNSKSFIGGIYALLGMENIADAAPDEFNSGFPQLSTEYIVASDPDVIFLTGFGESAETLAARQGWDSMTAVSSGSVFVLDADVASRWGPRVVDLLQAISAAVESAPGK